RGTVVHAVLEHLYDLPAADRTLDRALALVTPRWQALLAERPELAQLFPDGELGPPADLSAVEPPADLPVVEPPADLPVVEPPADSELGRWLASARQLVANYFELEDPRFLEPAAREELVEVVLDGLRLR